MLNTHIHTTRRNKIIRIVVVISHFSCFSCCEKNAFIFPVAVDIYVIGFHSAFHFTISTFISMFGVTRALYHLVKCMHHVLYVYCYAEFSPLICVTLSFYASSSIGIVATFQQLTCGFCTRNFRAQFVCQLTVVYLQLFSNAASTSTTHHLLACLCNIRNALQSNTLNESHIHTHLHRYFSFLLQFSY